MTAARTGAGLLALFLWSAVPLLAQRPERVPSEPVPLPADSLTRAPLVVEEESPRTWLLVLDGVWGFTVEHYNRVDGLTPAWGIALDPTDPERTPAIASRVARATTHDRWYGSVTASQRLPLPGALVARIEAFHRSATFDDWKVWIHENDVASFVAASDLLDWWREAGVEAALDAESFDGRLAGGVAYLDASQHSQRSRDPFSLFGDEWRDNPPVREGRLRALRWTVRYDTRDVQSPLLPSPGWSVSGTVETAGGVLGGDLDFTRAAVDARRYVRLGRDAWWDSRAVWMGPLGGGVPPQREVRLGGPGSLRGFPAASFAGDQGVQGQTELRLPLPVTDEIAILFLSWHWVAFLEAGAVATDGVWDDLHADVGTGISGINLFSYVGLFVAQRITDLNGGGGGPRFVVRLRRDF